ncbi:response regulator transcription factor [Massilia sp. TWR1-2-2]|uniref:response regulator transcription factor n=1 Tax=Massilia sp. TWR1-2-2 TaxID=2804584 RepID=UPI003CFA9B96
MNQDILILNVDDNDGARYVKTRILLNAGFRVEEAANGTDALLMVTRVEPALVLLDVKLPDINGIEVCRRIKGDPATCDVLVLQTSAALTGRDDKIRGLEGGADNYLAAPIEADELVANVRALLRLQQTAPT